MKTVRLSFGADDGARPVYEKTNSYTALGQAAELAVCRELIVDYTNTI